MERRYIIGGILLILISIVTYYIISTPDESNESEEPEEEPEEGMILRQGEIPSPKNCINLTFDECQTTGECSLIRTRNGSKCIDKPVQCGDIKLIDECEKHRHCYYDPGNRIARVNPECKTWTAGLINEDLEPCRDRTSATKCNRTGERVNMDDLACQWGYTSAGVSCIPKET